MHVVCSFFVLELFDVMSLSGQVLDHNIGVLRNMNTKTYLRVIIKAEELVTISLVVVLAGLTLLQVLGRNIEFFPSFMWTEELSRLALVWLIAFGSCYVMARGEHITVDVIPLSGRVNSVVQMVSVLVTIAVTVVMAIASFRYLDRVAGQRLATVKLPMGLFQLAGVAGFSLMTLHGIERLVRLGSMFNAVTSQNETNEKENNE